MYDGKKTIAEKISPADAYNAFCNKCGDNITEEIEEIKLNSNLTSEEIKNKIKKTFKNRYYNYFKHQQH